MADDAEAEEIMLRADEGRGLDEAIEDFQQEEKTREGIIEKGLRVWLEWATPTPMSEVNIAEKRVRSLSAKNVDKTGSGKSALDVVEGRIRYEEPVSGRYSSVNGSRGRYSARNAGRPDPFTDLKEWFFGPKTRTARFFLRLGLSSIILPVVFSSFCRIFLISPVLESRLSSQNWFQITEEQEEEVAVKVERVRQRLEYSELMGRAPQISGEDFLDSLRVAGEKFETEERRKNKDVITNVLADSLSTGLLTAAIVFNRRRVNLLRGWLGERFFGLEASTQAFTLLLIADVLVGYHSSDGWITGINLVLGHYGITEHESFTSIFVAIVPVTLDVTFKYWVFKSLRKIAPSTQIILSEIEE